MAADPRHGVGANIAAARRAAGWTQRALADASRVSYGMVRAVERGGRLPGEDVLDALAGALGVAPDRLLGNRGASDSRVHEWVPSISRSLADYDAPEEGPVRSLAELAVAVDETVRWRLSAQYLRLARRMPTLLDELTRALYTAAGEQRAEVARLLAASRAADAVAFKFGYPDLSARLIELMRWAAPCASDPLVDATVAYVRTETFFAARAHTAGLRALEAALDAAPPPCTPDQKAARGALHMRAAVVAGRARQTEGATCHLDEARRLGDEVPEGVYGGTAFGPSSVRIHEVAVAVGLGDEHVHRVRDVTRAWAPPRDMPAERHSGFYIEVARAQLWEGRVDDAYESLKAARRLAPQHTREHPWVREDIVKVRRLKRGAGEDLTRFMTWCNAL